MNIFVAGLSYQLEENDVKETFEEYGEVESVKLIIDKLTGKKRGFGFVIMPNDEEAKKAIVELDGLEIYGRKITVSVAEPRKDNNNRGGFSGNRSDYKGGGYNKRENRENNRDTE